MKRYALWKGKGRETERGVLIADRKVVRVKGEVVGIRQ